MPCCSSGYPERNDARLQRFRKTGWLNARKGHARAKGFTSEGDAARSIHVARQRTPVRNDFETWTARGSFATP
jgi:hypothetical protein